MKPKAQVPDQEYRDSKQIKCNSHHLNNGWCWVNTALAKNGKYELSDHIHPSRCRCIGSPSPDCPVREHANGGITRSQAEKRSMRSGTNNQLSAAKSGRTPSHTGVNTSHLRVPLAPRPR